LEHRNGIHLRNIVLARVCEDLALTCAADQAEFRILFRNQVGFRILI
jgi:hypothetical protein